MPLGPFEISALSALAIVLIALVVLRRPTKPPLQLLAEVFGEPPGTIPGSKARTWALGVLYEAGVDADSDPVYAIRVLRQAEPRLSLAAAKVLVDTLNRY